MKIKKIICQKIKWASVRNNTQPRDKKLGCKTHIVSTMNRTVSTDNRDDTDTGTLL